ncbi:MAG: hypothetical protein FWG87_08525 [Defluviitaleaceae bacterium]|nr:hypothetical protein [Defluviitaleaceae bacterium]
MYFVRFGVVFWSWRAFVVRAFCCGDLVYMTATCRGRIYPSRGYLAVC